MPPNLQDTSPAINFAAGVNQGLAIVTGAENLRASEVSRRNTESVIRARDAETNFSQLTQGLSIVERMDALKTAALTRQKIEQEMAHMPQRLALELDTARVVNEAEHAKNDLLKRFGAEKALADLEATHAAVDNERARRQIQKLELLNNTRAAQMQVEFDGVRSIFDGADVGDPAGMFLSSTRFQAEFAGSTNPLINQEIRKLKASALTSVGEELVALEDPTTGRIDYKPVKVPFTKIVSMAELDFNGAANKAYDIWGIPRDKFVEVVTQVQAEKGRVFNAPGTTNAADEIRRRVEELRSAKDGKPKSATPGLTPEQEVVFYGQAETESKRSAAEGRAEAAKIEAVAKSPADVVARISKSPDVAPGVGKQVTNDLKLFAELRRKGKSKEEARSLLENRWLSEVTTSTPYSPRGGSYGVSVKTEDRAAVRRRLSLLDAALAE